MFVLGVNIQGGNKSLTMKLMVSRGEFKMRDEEKNIKWYAEDGRMGNYHHYFGVKARNISASFL